MLALMGSFFVYCMEAMMNFIFTRVCILFSFLLFFGTAFASQPTTFIGPTARVGYTDSFTNATAYSVAGELGLKNYRVSGTVGWQLVEAQRLKVTGEYLVQKLNYSFFSGNSEQWVNQGALGAQYEYDFLEHSLKPQFDLTGYYSHAPNKTLNVTMGRIAGSNAGGLAPGVSIHPWSGATAGVALNYDNVSYDYLGSSTYNAKGFGGTARFDQALMENVDLGLIAGIRQPFNNYQANLNWTTESSVGEWIWGLSAEYTDGKNQLPNSYNVIVSINFLADYHADTAKQSHSSKRFKDDYKDEALPVINNDFKRWITDPAVHMPQVLAIAQDPAPSPSGCTLAAPTLLSAFANPPQFVASGTILSAPHFAGSNLTYTLTQVTPFVPALPPSATTVTINSTTGVITVNYVANAVSYTGTYKVTATNCAGSVTSNTFTISLQ